MKPGLKPKIILLYLAGGLHAALAQPTKDEKFGRVGILNTITTAVPFLMISPDARSGAMGDAGVALSPDANSIHYNCSKLAFVKEKMGIAVSYTPWLKKLVPDISLSYLSFYNKLDNNQTIGGSLRYFSLGEIIGTDETGHETGIIRPNEFALDVAYARLLSEKYSAGIALRYIFSDLTGGISVGSVSSKPGRAIAADISAHYRNEDFELWEKDAALAFGVNISNIGNKISYTDTPEKDFIPINLKLGSELASYMDDYNTVRLVVDVTKLLVPTPPLFIDLDSINSSIPSGTKRTMVGKNPDKSIVSGMLGSFSDAPGIPRVDDKGMYILNPDGSIEVEKGSVFKEELREINYSAGIEYWYDNQFAFRAGYFYEHALKGNRRFLTLGAGVKYNVFSLDFSYLIPTTQQNPLENTLRFTLLFDFEALKTGEEAPVEGQ